MKYPFVFVGSTMSLEGFLDRSHVLLLFAPEGGHIALLRQLKQVRDSAGGAAKRDLAVFQVYPDAGVDPEGRYLGAEVAGDLRRRFAPDAAFGLVLLGRDGQTAFRSKESLSARDLFARIDELPDRRPERELDRAGAS